MEREPPRAAREWRDHWTLVLASMAGMSFAAVAPAIMGLAIEPLGSEFGWSRAEISAGLTVYALIGVPLSPFVGAAIDRWGARRLAIPGIVLSAMGFAGFSLANGSTVQWLALWMVYACFVTTIRNTPWTSAVTSIFVTARGTALALTLCGAAISQTLAPIIAQRLIDGEGWRFAYVAMGLGWGAVVLALLVAFFFDARDVRRRDGKVTAKASGNAELPGLTPGEALRDPALIRIATSMLLAIIVLSALNVHLVPILGERGIARETAALMAGMIGGAALVGKLFTGWAHDRGARGWIDALSLGAPMLACVALTLAGDSLPLIALGVICVGYGNGAAAQACAYLTGRYGGIRNFGRIFGVMSSIIALGLGIGPVLAGGVFDVMGGYAPFLHAGIPVGLVSGLLVFSLGAYPDWSKREGRAGP